MPEKILTEKTPAGFMPGPLFRDHLASKRSTAMKTNGKPVEKWRRLKSLRIPQGFPKDSLGIP